MAAGELSLVVLSRLHRTVLDSFCLPWLGGSMSANPTRSQKTEETKQALKVKLGFYAAWSLVSHCSACRDTRRLPVGTILKGRERMVMSEVVSRLRCRAKSLKGHSCGEPPMAMRSCCDRFIFPIYKLVEGEHARSCCC